MWHYIVERSNKVFLLLKKWIKGVFVWWKVIFWKSLSKLSCICLSIKKLVNGKHFSVTEKFDLISRKVFSFYFGQKTLFRNCEKFRNIIYLLIISNLILKLLIAIYILFWIFFFQFHPLEFNFYINFGSHFYNCYLLFPLSFFNWNFLSIKFGSHSFDCYLFYLK
jgi:hypothetical protein